MKNKGHLLVIEGSDGSGKSTQAKLLLKYLKLQGIKHKYTDYPRYYTSFHGRFIGKLLKGDFGDIEKVSPYFISLAYAFDRLTSKNLLEKWLRDGNIVVANRYVTSSIAYQTIKLPKNKQKEFMDWLTELEYRIHKLPKEDAVIYLHVPSVIAQKLIEKRNKKKYLGNIKKDLNEANISYLKKVENMYNLLSSQNRWIKIECAKNGIIKSKEEINKEIIKNLKNKHIL